MKNGIVFFERQILSLGLIEKGLYELYTNLSEKIADLAAKALFSYIATDSLKHSTLLVSIIEEVGGTKVKEKDCSTTIKYNLDLINTLSKKISKGGKIYNNELLSIIYSLTEFESLLHKEYSKAFGLNTNRFFKENTKVNKEEKLDIFNLIVDDEERHQRILSSIVRLCDKKLDFKNNAPVVKYQNPDAWYVPRG